jgi:hypothetical protein
MTTPDITPDITPVPRQKGRYNLFDTPDGGIHISYTIEGSEEVEHIEVPGKLLQMAKMMENGSMSPLKAFSALRRMANG